MLIRKAKQNEINKIMNIIKKAVSNMISQGIEQWDDIYPNEEVIKRDLYEESLYVYYEEMVKGIIVLNEHQDDEYETVEWKMQYGRPMVIHRLCIDPDYQGIGIAKAMIDFAEGFAVNNKYDSIRLDAFVYNNKACRLYEGKGYKRVGVVNFRKGPFYCYEKYIV